MIKANTNLGRSRVHKVSSTGAHVAVWGSKGTNNGQFISQTGIAVDSSNNIYVMDVRHIKINNKSIL
jgi:hypothetical protein